MAEIEGGGWSTMMERASDNTVASALRALERRGPFVPDPDDPGDRPPIVHTIYGDGGIDRWYVRQDGSVVFSRSHAYPPERVDRAQAWGFGIE